MAGYLVNQPFFKEIKKNKNMTKVIIYIVFIVFLIVGEVKCIVKFFQSDFEPSYKREAIYGFSSLMGLGIIVGWMDFPDESVKVVESNK